MQDDPSFQHHASDPNKWRSWDQFLASNANAGFRQSSWYANLKTSYNDWDHFAAVIKHRDDVVGGAVVFARTFAPNMCYYYVPEGPVLLEDDSPEDQQHVFRAVLEFIEQKRKNERKIVSHLTINPPWTSMPGFVADFQRSGHYYGLPRDTQCIDLRSSESAILAQMKPKGRYNIGLSRRHGVVIVEDVSPSGIEDFLDICGETFTRKRIDGIDPDYFCILIPMLAASERGSVFFAEYRGTRLATALVVYFGHTATYYYGGSRAADRKVMAPYLLHFEIMRKAKSLGYGRYDLFGVTPEAEPNDDWTDISVFKRKFGGQELRFVPTLEYIYDASAYQAWKAVDQARRKDRRERRAVDQSLQAG